MRIKWEQCWHNWPPPNNCQRFSDSSVSLGISLSKPSLQSQGKIYKPASGSENQVVDFRIFFYIWRNMNKSHIIKFIIFLLGEI